MTPHRLLNPGGLPPASGYAHVVVPAEGRTIHLAGQIAADSTGAVVGETVAEQFDVAFANVVGALEAVGATPEQVVTVTIYTTTMAEYRESLGEIGRAYRRHMGGHYPAMAVIGVGELFEPAAKIEIVATAVAPNVSERSP